MLFFGKLIMSTPPPREEYWLIADRHFFGGVRGIIPAAFLSTLQNFGSFPAFAIILSKTFTMYMYRDGKIFIFLFSILKTPAYETEDKRHLTPQ